MESIENILISYFVSSIGGLPYIERKLIPSIIENNLLSTLINSSDLKISNFKYKSNIYNQYFILIIVNRFEYHKRNVIIWTVSINGQFFVIN